MQSVFRSQGLELLDSEVKSLLLSILTSLGRLYNFYNNVSIISLCVCIYYNRRHS